MSRNPLEPLTAKWDAFFFRPMSESTLAAFRVVFYLAALGHSVYHYLLSYLDYPAYMFKPAGIFVLFPVPQPAREVMVGLYLVLWTLLGLSALGSGVIPRLGATLLAFYVYGIRYNYGFNFKAESGICLCLLILAFSHCDDAFSLRNRLWPSRSPDPQQLVESRAQGFYSWPVQFIRVYWVFLIFSAGAFKLIRTGWVWASGDSIHQVLWRQMYYFYPVPDPPTALGSFLLQHQNFTLLASWLSLLIELLAPLILLGGAYRVIILGNIVVMLTIVRFTMHHSFVLAHLPLYLAVLPWEEWGPRLLEGRSSLESDVPLEVESGEEH